MMLKKGLPSDKEAGRPREEMQDNLLFLRKFFKHGIRIASIWPSSRAMSVATINQVNFAKAQVIVELGAGTGPITREVIERLAPETRFLAIERDADFASVLRRRFASYPNVEIIQADVRDIDALLKERKIQKVDYFVSGLPTPSLPPAVRRRIFAAVRKYLTPEGVYTNITEFPWIYWRYYKGIFQQVNFQLVMANMPPAGVYHCRAMRPVVRRNQRRAKVSAKPR